MPSLPTVHISSTQGHIAFFTAFDNVPFLNGPWTCFGSLIKRACERILSAIIPVEFPLLDSWQEVVEQLVYQRRCKVGGLQRRYGMAKPARGPKFRIRVFDRVCQQNTHIETRFNLFLTKRPQAVPKYISAWITMIILTVLNAVTATGAMKSSHY
jgi:hypothetical protein